MGCICSIPKKGNESDKIRIGYNNWFLSNELGYGQFGWVRYARCFKYRENKKQDGYYLDGAVKIFAKSSRNSKYIADINDGLYPIEIACNEINTISSLSHDNIVKYIGTLYSHSYIYMVMEYVDGMTLYNYIHQKHISEHDNINTLRDLTHTINYIHSKGLVYLDLKPENIMVPGNNIKRGIKLIDFGSVYNIYNPTDHIICSKGYCDPESYYTGKITIKTDVWSLGVISFIMAHKYMPIDCKLYKLGRPPSSWPKIRYKFYNKTAIDLWSRLLTVHSINRYSTIDILEHPWLNTLT